MDITESQSFCCFCKKSLVFSEKFYHFTCQNEVTNFNQNSAIKLDLNNYQIHLLTILLTVTSLRLPEVLTLKKNNFDFENNQINFRNKKFKITDSQNNELIHIFNKLQVSENLFSMNVNYPSKYFPLKKFCLKSSNNNFALKNQLKSLINY